MQVAFTNKQMKEKLFACIEKFSYTLKHAVCQIFYMVYCSLNEIEDYLIELTLILLVVIILLFDKLQPRNQSCETSVTFGAY